ncbi:MAG: N-acetylmuramoyl-L-alanine amidase [Acutalibacteraceae bacterium]|nr:N-acetylmuramoyl-L-alanine amidase [Acutalibacteraceae bacterium]
MKYLKLSLYILVITLCAVLSVVFFSSDKTTRVSSETHNSNPVIIVDAGHGGFDGGAVADDGTCEKDINLNIALTLGDILEANGYEVVFTRTEDVGTDDYDNTAIRNRKISDLNNRLKLTTLYDDALFVSVHLNKFPSSKVWGAQVFYSPSFDEAKDLSKSIQNSIASMIQPDNNRTIKQGTKDTFLLHKAVVPSVIVECGFLSNNEELYSLKTTEYQKQMAFAIFCGINEYLNKE